MVTSKLRKKPVADPDLRIRVGGGGSHPDPEIKRGGPGLKKKFWSVWCKNKGGQAPLGLSPGSATANHP